MTASRIALIGLVFLTSLSFTQSRAAGGPGLPDQDDPVGAKPRVLTPGAPGMTLASINEDYVRQLVQLERQRLDRLGQLAMRQAPKEAAETYEQLFRLAVANNLFREAEPAAQRVLKSTEASPPVVQFLARTIDIIASADRGAYEESLAELRNLLATASIQGRPGDAASPSLDTAALLAICDAYQQRLLQGGQFEAARQACHLVSKESSNPAIKAFCASRLAQLDMIGKPAPAIQGDRSGRQAGQPGRP